MKRLLTSLLVAAQALFMLAGCDNSSHPVQSGSQLISVQITPAAVQLPIGLSQELIAIAHYEDGSSKDVSQLALWITDADTVASLSQNATEQGQPVTGVTVGQAGITALYGGVTSEPASVTVTNATVTALRITPSNTTLPKGLSQQFHATATLSDGSALDVTSNAALSWRSSDSAIASVDGKGLALGLAAGSSTIKASGQANGASFEASASLTVTDHRVTALTVTPLSAAVAKGFSQQFKAIATFSDGNTLDVSDNQALTWSSSDPSVASVDGQGLALGMSVGSSTIKASGQANGVSFEASASLTVTSQVLTSLTITPTSVTLPKGFSQQLQAIATFSDGSTLDVTNNRAIVWRSADSSLATVDRQGLVNGMAAGSTSISAARRVNGAELNASSKVTVTRAELTDIQLTPLLTQAVQGATVQFQAQGSFSDGSTHLINPEVNWTSSDEAVATINLLGRAHTQAVGTTNISASRAGILSNEAELRVVTNYVTTWGASSAGGDSSAVQPLIGVSSISTTTNTQSSAFAALRSNGTVASWGASSEGGDSSAVQAQLVEVASLVANETAFAAIREDGTVVTWGLAVDGGDSSAVQSRLNDVKAIYANIGAFAAVKGDGSVVTWGDDTAGSNSSAVQSQLTRVASISATSNSFAALKQDGTVVAWGESGNGGNSSAVQSQLIDVKTITGTTSAFAALRRDGTVVTWGAPHLGGDSSAVQPQLIGVKRIFSNDSAFAALKQDGTVVSWGDADNGGDSSVAQIDLTDVVDISHTLNAFAALKQDGTVAAWGNQGGNSSGVQAQLTDVKAITGANAAFAARKGDGSVVTWGMGSNGGNSSTVQADLVGVTAISATANAFAAIRSDGSVVSWGNVSVGGDSSSVQPLTLVQSITGSSSAFAAISLQP